MARTVRRFCPAKINLFLEVRGRRPDGFHEILTVLAPVDLGDLLEVREARGFSLAVEGASLPGVNTVEKAWRAALRRRRFPGARVRLVKRVPAGSGLGGGSSDAAAFLRALEALYGPIPDLEGAAAEVGSDVPFFLAGGPALAAGRGEILAPLARAPRLHAVILWPGFPLSTASVYARVREFLTNPSPDVMNLLNALDRGDAPRLGRALFNRLEGPAFALRPVLGRLRARMARLPFSGVRLTGSGSALFGLCASRAEARRLAGRLRRDEPGAFVTEVSGWPGEEPWRSPRSASS
jgi:4-diphosphocytidyl-2-C-methyl-D-erythritol kinase